MMKKTNSVNDAFRSSLQDVVVILKEFEDDCCSTRELIELMELALTNESQLNIIMKRLNHDKEK